MVARIIEEDGRVFGEIRRGPEQEPVRPMRGVETGHKKMGETGRRRRGAGQRFAIELRHERESAGPQLFSKASHDRLKGREAEALEIPAGGLEAIEGAQQIVGRTQDGFRGQVVRVGFVVCRFAKRFFRRDGEEQTQMFAERQRLVVNSAQHLAQSGRGNELKAEIRFAFLKQTRLQRMRMAARRNDHHGGQRLFP